MAKRSSLIPKMKKDLFERKRESKVYYIALILVTAMFLIFTLGGGTGFTGTFGRIAGFFILVIIGYGLVDWSLDITERHGFWKEKEEIDGKANLRMRDTSKTLERASKGEKTSQKNLSERIAKTFLINLKEKRDLTEEELEELLKDEEELRRIVDDKVISDFIFNEFKGDEKEKDNGFLSSSEDPKEYRKKIEQVIRRIEKWD